MKALTSDPIREEVKMSKRVLLPIALALIVAALVACGGKGETQAATALGSSGPAPSQQVTVDSLPSQVTTDSPGQANVEIAENVEPLVGLEALDVVAAYEEVLSGIYASALPSVVQIQVQKSTGPRQSPAPGQGSGFVWSDEGHIVTNHHVVDGADRIRVVFADGSAFPAEVVGSDPGSDLAVIKIEPPARGLRPAILGDSDRLKVGQLAVAIGSPFGQDFSMTRGIISALERSLRAGRSFFANPQIIQTDAPINPGNSGGPLLDRLGRVIGINSQIISNSGSSSGVGFAVPINTGKRVIPELIANGAYEYAYLGISGASLNPVLARVNGLPQEAMGVLIVTVVDGGPADAAGIRGSDETSQVDGVDYPTGGSIIRPWRRGGPRGADRPGRDGHDQREARRQAAAGDVVTRGTARRDRCARG